jgi:hypothetical protein
MNLSSASKFSSELTTFLFNDKQTSLTVSLDYRNFRVDGKDESETRVTVEPKRQPGILKTYVYEITLRINGKSPLTFTRRYSELHQLYARLVHEFPFILFPDFPHKDFTMKYVEEKQKIDRRALELQSFFVKLLSNSILRNTNFLKLLMSPDVFVNEYPNFLSTMKEKIVRRLDRKKMSIK